MCAAGSCLGLDVILSSDRLRDMSDSISLCFTQTWSLSQKTIFELLPDYPQAYRIVRKSAMRMALSRAMKRAADLLRASDKWRVGRPEYSFLAVFDEAMQLASDVGPISHDDWKKRAAEAGSKMSGLRLLQRDDLKPPTVDDQMRALHAKVCAAKTRARACTSVCPSHVHGTFGDTCPACARRLTTQPPSSTAAWTSSRCASSPSRRSSTAPPQ